MPVDGVVQRLTHLGVVERRLADIHADQGVAEVRDLGRDNSGGARQRVDGDRVHPGKKLVGTTCQSGLAGTGFRDDVELEPGQFGQPGHVVFGVLDHADIGVRHPLVELEGPGSDRAPLQFGRLGNRLRGHDGQRGELAHQGQGGGVQRDDHLALVVHDVLDHRKPAGIWRGGLAVLHPLERGHHIGRRHGFAIMELDAGL